MALRRLREKEAVNYMELHCGKPIAFGKRERKAEVLSELFDDEITMKTIHEPFERQLD
jgi:hypothetical protein